ncbi:hypothetical protein [Nocardioides yefusunii]|uniref:Uncharacterized protein n=1 Tax=Nocardioides yefusunii TaxID=2500546 RepID=A0ABW1R1B2_9ACTN|nr:hypothetical protein [Nocardioides yefusunii]
MTSSPRATFRAAPRGVALRRLGAAAAVLLLGAVTTACSEGEFEVGTASVESTASTDGSGATPGAGGTATSGTTPATDPAAAADTSANGAVATPGTTADGTPPTLTPVNDPDLDPTHTTLGSFHLQFPLGWTAIPGIQAMSDGETSRITGGAIYTAVPAAGKDQAAWVTELMSGASAVTGLDGQLTQSETIIQSDGREVFHLGQDYAEGRAQLYGYVEGDTLHLLRFGLDGTPAAVDVTERAVASGVHVVPVPDAVATTP